MLGGLHKVGGRLRRRLGIALCVVGALLLVGAVGLVAYNAWQADRAGESVDAAMEELHALLPEDALHAATDDGVGDTDAGGEATFTIDGYDYIGYLSIPALELELPVMAEWDMTRLNIAPCRYYGALKTNDLVIAGHSYIQHFGRLPALSAGDAVYFVDASGGVHAFTVAASEVIEPTDVSAMLESDYDLTLFTCNFAGDARHTVRCVAA